MMYQRLSLFDNCKPQTSDFSPGSRLPRSEAEVVQLRARNLGLQSGERVHIETPPPASPADLIADTIFTVTEALALMNGILEPLVLTIEGEVSGYRVNQGKWVFFDIKDEGGVLSCFMVLHQMSFPLTDGMKIRLRATPKIRVGNGRLGLTVKSFELIGEGLLRKAFEELRQKLEHEGLFDAKWKKPLPLFPTSIGLVTSKSGDALQDMLRIMQNLSGGLSISLVPVTVQGQTAVAEICSAIVYLNSHHPVDVIIVARGGGSAEDLQAFNAEPVVRAIFASKIPVVTGVGHEPDVTLADFVADVRAATPTNAAEIVAPHFAELLRDLQAMQKHLSNNCQALLKRKQALTDSLLHRLTQSLASPKHQTDRLKERLIYQLKQRERLFWQQQRNVLHLAQRFVHARQAVLTVANQRLALLDMQLSQLDPNIVLARGYSITTAKDGTIIRSVKQLLVDQAVSVQLSDGIVETKVLKFKI